MLSTDNEFKSMSCNKLVGLSEVHVEGIVWFITKDCNCRKGGCIFIWYVGCTFLLHIDYNRFCDTCFTFAIKFLFSI